MHVIIFEDSPESPYVKFLQQALGYDVRGAGGVGNLRAEALKALNDGADCVYCIADVPQDNPQARIAYSKLLTFCRRHPSVTPVPIVCIEEFVLRQLHKIGLGHVTGAHPVKGIEAYYKSLMAYCVPACQQVKSTKVYGSFYARDCDCCALYHAILPVKAGAFLHALPMRKDMRLYVEWFNNRTGQNLAPTI